jgi:phage terminase large subunit
LIRWLNVLPPQLHVLLNPTSDRVELVASPEGAFISARTSRAEKPEALAGIHAQHVLIVVDEASGVPEPVFEAAIGSMSGASACTILLGNPTRASGTFFETQTRLSNSWWVRRWSCLDSPLVSKEFIEEVKQRYGEESNAYRVRVLGEFPLGDDDTIIPLYLAEEAQNRDVVFAPDTRPVWGLDVARFGSDRTCLAEKTGQVITGLEAWRGLDLMQTVGRVKARFDALTEGFRPRVILVDSIGLGSGVVDRMRELKLPVRGINVSESPAMGDTYNNLRTELIFRTRAWLEQRNAKLPNDAELIAEMTCIRYSFTSSGKMKAESKDDMRRRGLPSPDKADAVFLTMADNAANALGIAGTNWSKPLRRGLKGIA